MVVGSLPLRMKIAGALALATAGGWVGGPLPALVSTAFACLAYIALAATVVRPVEELRCALTASNRRVKPRYADELGALADDLNRMLVNFHVAQQELMAARDEANAASQARIEFLANMSHEIRTPLNGIMGLTDLVLQTDLTPLQRGYLRSAAECSESLLGVINEVLDFSKLESGHTELELKPFGLRAALASALRVVSVRAHDKGLELISRVDRRVNDLILADPMRLRQVLVNLVSNAVKFTDEGEIVVQVDLERQEGNRARLHFRVSDSGIGIPPEVQERIFQPFTQADNSTSRQFQGTGLGLTIVSRLVELMRGRLWLESEVGRGTTFHVLVEVGVEAVQPAPPSDLAGLRVLVVEDNATCRSLLHDTLRELGMEPVSVAHAQEAAYLAGVGRPYALILSDEPVTGTNLPPVLHMLSPTRGGHSEAGPCLNRPFSESELVDAIRGLLTHSQPAQPEPVKCARPLKVLLAEDNEINQLIAVNLLEQMGHRVTAVSDGTEVLAELLVDTYDLLIVDIQMPRLDGFGVAAALRAHPRRAGMPMLALTANALPADRERCLAAGMDGYVAKPIVRAELVAEIERVLAPVAQAA